MANAQEPARLPRITGTLNLGSAGVQWSREITDTLIGHRFSQLQAIEIPSIEELPNYHGSLILNHTFAGLYDAHLVRILINFIRKLVVGIHAYRTAREKLHECFGALDQSNARIQAYLAAIDQLETCVLKVYPGMLCAWAATQIFAQQSKPLNRASKPFAPEDGSDYDRLRLMYNRIKHFDEDLLKFAAKGSKDVPVAPIWVEDARICCLHTGTVVSLTFEELVEVMRAASVDAEYFSEQILSDIRNRQASKTTDEKE